MENILLSWIIFLICNILFFPIAVFLNNFFEEKPHYIYKDSVEIKKYPIREGFNNYKLFWKIIFSLGIVGLTIFFLTYVVLIGYDAHKNKRESKFFFRNTVLAAFLFWVLLVFLSICNTSS